MINFLTQLVLWIGAVITIVYLYAWNKNRPRRNYY